MNLRLIAACATAAFAAPALAEGSVTLSGVMDAAVRQVDNEGVGSAKSVVSGSNATSRLIFSGREDLGAGLGAGFHLEHGLLADVGTPSSADKFWDRRSTVSLTSETFGTERVTSWRTMPARLVAEWLIPRLTSSVRASSSRSSRTLRSSSVMIAGRATGRRPP